MSLEKRVGSTDWCLETLREAHLLGGLIKFEVSLLSILNVPFL